MKLVFENSGEMIAFNIDRQNKILKVSSQSTNYKEIELKWKMLFDKGKEEEQDKIMEALSDIDFEDIIRRQMEIYGYKQMIQNASNL